MTVKDNKTSQPAIEYDGNIGMTMPYYDLFHINTLNLVEVINPDPQQWLDAGCGTGTLVEKAAERFVNTRFTLADPSPAMLEIAREKLNRADFDFFLCNTDDLTLAANRFDVITAILSHHYSATTEDRCRTAAQCCRMLKPGGVYVNFESFRPVSEQGFRIAIEGWRRAQLARGKQKEAVEKYLKRCDVEFFPVTVDSQMEMLREAGFSVVELFWLSGMQAGIYAIK